jgi:protein O-GlcNAc transferase
MFTALSGLLRKVSGSVGKLTANVGKPDPILDDAETRYQALLATSPHDFSGLAEAANFVGSRYFAKGDYERAEAWFNRALAADANSPTANFHMGHVFRIKGAHQDALRAFEKATNAGPFRYHAQLAIGGIHWNLADLEQALSRFERALKIEPKSHLAKVYIVYLKQMLADWSDLKARMAAARSGALTQRSVDPDPSVPFAFLSIPAVSPSEQLAYASRYAREMFGSAESAKVSHQAADARRPRRKRLRIGYLSADFREHPVAHLFAPVLEHHDRKRFETFAYALGPRIGSPLRDRIERSVDHVVPLHGISDHQAADLIRNDDVDVLVDLMGYTQHHRAGILARRPARVQVNYLGYSGTMGASFIDYLIADEFVIPRQLEAHYSERILRMPLCYLPRDGLRPRRAAPTRAASGLPADGLVFCCFNKTYKITPSMFDVWCRLLRAIPASVFWLPVKERRATENLRREAAARGVDSERFVIAPRVTDYDDHLARMQCADLFLDTAPYNAHTTSSDALWMGVPLLTCSGETFASRVAGSLLTALGMPELVTYDLDDYYARALALAENPEMLRAARTKLAEKRESTGIFDPARFTRDLEALYTII